MTIQASPAPLELDPSARENLTALMRMLRVGEDMIAAILEVVDEPMIANNLPVPVLVWLYLDGPMRPTTVARLTGLTSGGVSGLLERMESAGLVTRSFGQVPEDRRGIVIQLTDKGLRNLLLIADRIDAVVEAFLHDMEDVIERRVPRRATRAEASRIGPDGDGTAATGEPAAPLPDAELRRHTRENLSVILRLAEFGEELTRRVQARTPDPLYTRNATALTMHGLATHGSLRPSEIATITGLTSGGVSGLLERMEAAGLVTREFGLVPGDRRGVVVRLTEAGLQALLVVADEVADPMERVLDDWAAAIALRARRPDAVAVSA